MKLRTVFLIILFLLPSTIWISWLGQYHSWADTMTTVIYQIVLGILSVIIIGFFTINFGISALIFCFKKAGFNGLLLVSIIAWAVSVLYIYSKVKFARLLLRKVLPIQFVSNIYNFVIRFIQRVICIIICAAVITRIVWEVSAYLLRTNRTVNPAVQLNNSR